MLLMMITRKKIESLITTVRNGAPWDIKTPFKRIFFSWYQHKMDKVSKI